MHLHGNIAYYAFSLLLTVVLIFMVVAFLESKVPTEKTPGVDQRYLNAPVRWLIYFSLMTSSFILVDFQWPGYSDSLSFILILLLTLVPMNSQARLATVALCVLNHEGIALVLVPLIFFSFPREDRLRAIMVIGIFYGFMLGSHGFSVLTWFRGQGTVLDDTGSVWARVIQEPEVFLAGLFFTYKLFWVLLLMGDLDAIGHRHNRLTLMGLGVITLFPVALTLFAWDTTRVAGFGWLGLVMALGLFLKEQSQLPRSYHYAASIVGFFKRTNPILQRGDRVQGFSFFLSISWHLQVFRFCCPSPMVINLQPETRGAKSISRPLADVQSC